MPTPADALDETLIEVTLARTAACDTCSLHMNRGALAHMVLGGGARHLRCSACVACGVMPASRALPRVLAASPALTPMTPLGWGAIVTAASLLLLWRSRTARRVVVTAAVAVKTAFAMLVARLRGQKNASPAIVRRAFEDLGPTYIKLGQLVASSQGLFPERYSDEFRVCLDRVRPFAYEEVERTLREELGRDPAEVFASIDREPLASASIAQVHAAKLKDGADVVIKVQRPGIGDIIAADLRILRGLARVFEMLPSGELASPVDVVEDFEANLAEELDFENEASNMEEFNRIMVEHHQNEVAAPRVHRALTTRRVLVMERFYGHRVDDVERLRARNVDGEEKLLLGMRAWFQSMIHHGFFHGDVHAGNLMALDDGRIGFLDFGIVGRFPPERRRQVTDYLMALASGDFQKLADVMVAMGSAPGGVDRKALAADLTVAYEPLLASSLESVKYADMIPAIMRTSIKHRMRLPRDFVLVTKQMVYFDRYAKLLAPKLNIFRDSRVVTALAMDVMMSQLALAS
jgi:predicted unusual protein kinase regulating ubiquinone biosynthesis (AarF/ABC1/UbiB family)